PAGARPGGAVRVLKDLERVRAVESIVTYSQKLASLGRLTSGVAHEVKNPLNAMRIHLELIRTRLGGDHPEVAENVDVIADSLQRLDRVVQGFLRFMRPQDLRLQPVDANVVVAEVARVVDADARTAGVTIVLDPTPELPLVAADQELIHQATSNLATNGIQAMAPGGTLTLATRRAPGAGVEIRVVDQGVGNRPKPAAGPGAPTASSRPPSAAGGAGGSAAVPGTSGGGATAGGAPAPGAGEGGPPAGPALTLQMPADEERRLRDGTQRKLD